MNRRTLSITAAIAALAVAITGGGLWARSEVLDRIAVRTQTVTPGTVLLVAGRRVPLSGLTRQELAGRVASEAASAEDGVLVVLRDTARTSDTTLSAGDVGISADTTDAIDAAWAVGRDEAGSFEAAARERFLKAETPPATEIRLQSRVDTVAASALAGRLARAAAVSAKPDRIALSGGKPGPSGGREGYELATATVEAAVLDAVSRVDLADGPLEAGGEYSGKVIPKPAIRNEALVVSIARRQVTLWKDGKAVRTYPIAVGTASYPTPKGDFKVTLLRKNPSWTNPAPNGWGSDMPAFIPGGPASPLGIRAINISAPGIRFHGTLAPGTVGTAASHGCMRMRDADILDLFGRAWVGMPVFIR